MRFGKLMLLELILLLILLFFILAAYLQMQEQEEPNIESEVISQYRETVANQRYILHALGGEGGCTYINSIDCLAKNYDAGYRLFEVDVSFTSDNQLVLAHSTEHNVWSEDDWENKLGVPYDEAHPLASYDEFMNFRIQGKYKASSFQDLLDFMKEHDDLFIMIDPAYLNYAETQKLYAEIVRLADGDEKLLSHMIATGQSTEMMKAIKSVYDFPICNLYFSSDSRRERSICHAPDFVKFCRDNHIISFSIATHVFTKQYAAALYDSGLICYVFTINDAAVAQTYYDMGADVVGTDFLR